MTKVQAIFSFMRIEPHPKLFVPFGQPKPYLKVSFKMHTPSFIALFSSGEFELHPCRLKTFR
jgi:hypothetical protein